MNKKIAGFLAVLSLAVVVISASSASEAPLDGGRGLGLCPGVHFRREGSSLDTPTLAQFFRLYEEAKYDAAIGLLPSRLKDRSLYEKDWEKLPPYQRDEPIYFDIQAKASGEKALTKQDPIEKEILYYLGVMSYRMGDLEKARQRLLLCLQLDPAYRMAHVYLFRVYDKLETDLLSKSDGRTESTGQLFIDKLGFGTSDLHLDAARELENAGQSSGPRAVLVSFSYEKSRLKNAKIRFSSDPSPKERGIFFSAVRDPNLGRVELVTKDRHCLDEGVFATGQILYFDGPDESGKMVGGRTAVPNTEVSLELFMPRPADRAVVYDPAGRKIQDIPISKRDQPGSFSR